MPNPLDLRTRDGNNQDPDECADHPLPSDGSESMFARDRCSHFEDAENHLRDGQRTCTSDTTAADEDLVDDTSPQLDIYCLNEELEMKMDQFWEYQMQVRKALHYTGPPNAASLACTLRVFSSALAIVDYTKITQRFSSLLPTTGPRQEDHAAGCLL